MTLCLCDAGDLTLRHALYQLSHIEILNNSSMINTLFIEYSPLVEMGLVLVLFIKDVVMTDVER